ncbi:MAG: sialate O-acetylesterase [Methanobacterium sp.]|nr:sialate O-acetylesterase [Methanobacterium sp.]
MKFKIILLFIISFFSSCIPEERTEGGNLKNDIPCIIVIGQSNAAGYAPQESSPFWLKHDDYMMKDYLVWNRYAKKFQPYRLGYNVGSEDNSDSHFGFDIFFAQNYIDKYEGTLLCIKQTLDGVPISEKGSSELARWNPISELIPRGERNMIQELKIKMKEADDYSLKNDFKLIPIAILLHQGEGDASEVVRLNDYEENFKKLIAYLRNEIISDTIPIINGEIFYINDNFKRINSIFHSYSQSDNKFMTVSMKEYQTSIGDNLHYDARAHEYLGKKMFEYFELMK